MGIKHVLTTIFSAISRLADMRSRALSKCKIPFPLNPEKSLSETEYRVHCEHLLVQFHTALIERLASWQFYEMPMIGLYLENANRKLFKWKECVRLVYNKACVGVIDVAKHLFRDYIIDLSVRHPKVG